MKQLTLRDSDILYRRSGRGRIANYELAFRMQMAVPDLMDLKGETEATRKLYGLDDPKTQTYGNQCIVATAYGGARSAIH